MSISKAIFCGLIHSTFGNVNMGGLAKNVSCSQESALSVFQVSILPALCNQKQIHIIHEFALTECILKKACE